MLPSGVMQRELVRAPCPTWSWVNGTPDRRTVRLAVHCGGCVSCSGCVDHVPDTAVAVDGRGGAAGAIGALVFEPP